MVVPVLVLLFVALWFILRGDFLYVFPCVILFLCFSVLLVLRLPRLGKRELILVLFVRLFGLCLFRFVGFLFLLGSGKGCGLWLWHSLDCSLTFFALLTVLGRWSWCWSCSLLLCGLSCEAICCMYFRVSFCSCVFRVFGYCDCLAWGGGGWSWCFSCVCWVCACLGLSVSSSSWDLGGLRFVIVALPGLFSYLFSESEVPLLEKSDPPISDIHVSNEGVIKMMTGLNTSKALGADELHPRGLKELVVELCSFVPTSRRAVLLKRIEGEYRRKEKIISW